ncbi:transmembrane protein 198-like [Empidonax traillii]|uniref:transmembrane protein 198-like n=1 Tax=Empidonax traillii TaxID=164674 RepID=UPI000FFD6864|nr:transmembrane protein 198-like [Empidonax traillii]
MPPPPLPDPARDPPTAPYRSQSRPSASRPRRDPRDGSDAPPAQSLPDVPPLPRRRCQIARGAMDTGAPPAEPRCALGPRGPLEPVPAALCALGALLGLGCGCFGYRCFRAVMFLSGLLFGSAVIFLLCHRERVLGSPLSLEASAGIALGIGLLCGLLTALLRSVGLFTTGLLLGLLVAAAALAALAPAEPPGSPWVGAGVALGLALLGALSALRWPRALTVLGTGVGGAAALVVCADYFAEGAALVGFALARLRGAPGGPLCWPGWALLGAWPALSVTAVLLQWKVTAGGAPRGHVLSQRQKRLRHKEPKPPPEGPPGPQAPPTHRCMDTPSPRDPRDPPSTAQSLRDRQPDSVAPTGPPKATPLPQQRL